MRQYNFIKKLQQFDKSLVSGIALLILGLLFVIMGLVLNGCAKPEYHGEEIVGDVVLNELKHNGHIYLVFVYDRASSCSMQVNRSPDCKSANHTEV